MLVALAALAVACSDEAPLEPSPAADAGQPAPDAEVRADAGPLALDAGAEGDAGEPVGPRTDVSRLDLGTVTLGRNGEAGVDFELPEGTTSFTVVISGPEDGTFVVKSLEGPTGTLVSSDASGVSQLEQFLLGPFAAQFKSPNRVIQDRGVAASLFPNNPGVSVSGGAYQMTIAGLRIMGQQGMAFAGDVQVELLYRQRVVEGGVLDLHLYFSGAGGLSSDNAPADPLIVDALEAFREIYDQAGVVVGTVSYHDVDASFRTIEGIDGSDDQLERLFKLTEGSEPGLHFFFVDRFEAPFAGATVAGISGGLPGPPLRVGSFSSGVAVALSATMGNAGTLAHVMAHEGGHWLGLFHTSEITGTEDQMPDTPGGQAGNGFLMYPAVGGGTRLSDAQSAVLRSHGEVRAR